MKELQGFLKGSSGALQIGSNPGIDEGTGCGGPDMLRKSGDLDGLIQGMGVVPHMGGLGHVCQHVHGLPQSTISPREIEMPLILMILCGKVQIRLEVGHADLRRQRSILLNLQGRFVGREGHEETEGILRMIQSPGSGIDLGAVVKPVDLALIREIGHSLDPQRIVKMPHRRKEVRLVRPVPSHDDPTLHGEIHLPGDEIPHIQGGACHPHPSETLLKGPGSQGPKAELLFSPGLPQKETKGLGVDLAVRSLAPSLRQGRNQKDLEHENG